MMQETVSIIVILLECVTILVAEKRTAIILAFLAMVSAFLLFSL